jgi:hypothetical protein
MKVLTLYLAFYVLLVAAAVFVLWQSRILGEIPATWIALGAFVAVGLGVLLALVSRTHVATRE